MLVQCAKKWLKSNGTDEVKKVNSPSRSTKVPIKMLLTDQMSLPLVAFLSTILLVASVAAAVL